MAKNKEFIKVHKRVIFMGFFVSFIVLTPPLVIAILILNYYLRVYPGIFVDKTLVAGMRTTEAQETVANAHPLPASITIELQTGSGLKTTKLVLESIHARYDVPGAIDRAYHVGRNGNLFTDIGDILLAVKRPVTVDLPLLVDDQALDRFIETTQSQLVIPPTYPRFVLKNGEAQLSDGEPGEELPVEYAKAQILEAIASGKLIVRLSTKQINTALNEFQLDSARARGNGFLEKTLTLKLTEGTETILRADKLLPLLDAKGGYRQDTLQSFVTDYTDQMNKEVVEPIFRFENNRVQEFSPGVTGVRIQKEAFLARLVTGLSTMERTGQKEAIVDVPHEQTMPQTNISDVNNLGIQQLLGKGTSKFSGSIPSRIHNVALAASRLNGVLVPPGETFSFATAIGDISKYTGYKEAYIIRDGRTILGDGGGVCQVSTTLFRAVMSAGLPIVERHPHAYRVGYYEQDSGPGLDATVYVPSVDFKFKNDTPSYLLIQTKVDTKKLTAEFSIYGTSDGRTSKVTKPVLTDQIAPADDQYIDDPTLPTGKIVQAEHKAWGGKASFEYSVSRGGEIIYTKRFVSVYQPWRAVYMRGTAPQ